MLLAETPGGMPESYDPRVRFPSCKAFKVLDQKSCGPCYAFAAVVDQKSCGSCYAFAAVSALSARMCADSDGQYNVVMSAQQAVSCMGKDGCEGGNAPMVYSPMETEGLVADWCMPYTGKDLQGGGPQIAKDSLGLIEGSIQAMQEEILAHGPAFASFYIYNDFMLYSGGVYQASKEAKAQGEVGGHAVMVVGWGTDKATGLDYWLCQNSWSDKWGDKGFFKIRRGTDECSIESWGFWFATPVVPSKCGAQRCAHAGDLVKGCGCRCDAGWSGAACAVCPVTCGKGGKLDPRRCECVCRPGFSGARCDKQLVVRKAVVCLAGHGTPEWPELHWDIAEASERMVPGGYLQLFPADVEPWTAATGWATPASTPIRVCGDKTKWAPGKTCAASGMLKVPRLTAAGTYTLYWARYLGNNEFGVSRGYQQPLTPVFPSITVIEECGEVTAARTRVEAARTRVMQATIAAARVEASAKLEEVRLSVSVREQSIEAWEAAAAKVTPGLASRLVAPRLAFGSLPVQYSLPEDTPAAPRRLGLFPEGQRGSWYSLGDVPRGVLQGEVSLDVTGVPVGKYDLVLESAGILEASTPVEVARAHLRFDYTYSPSSMEVKVGWGIEPAAALPEELWGCLARHFMHSV
ncbi:hypothetical protein T484DRAFT_1786069 [Baffinella frigidus]|nr:hypothetical protein T484DRAFT_1786069 [Cryptophyta sp. CCMP2293]